MSAPVKRPKWSVEEIRALFPKTRAPWGTSHCRLSPADLLPLSNRVDAILAFYSRSSTVHGVKWLRGLLRRFDDVRRNHDRRQRRAKHLKRDRRVKRVDDAATKFREAIAQIDGEDSYEIEDDVLIASEILAGRDLADVCATRCRPEDILRAIVDAQDAETAKLLDKGDFHEMNVSAALAAQVENFRRSLED